MADLLPNVITTNVAAWSSDARTVPAACMGFPWLYTLDVETFHCAPASGCMPGRLGEVF
jgi:hypothetical protein